MPFSRKRGRRRHTAHVTIPLHIRMSTLLDIFQYTNGGLIPAQSSLAGAPPANVANVPNNPNPTQTLGSSAIMAEAIVSGQVGWYVFDWSKYSDISFVGNGALLPPAANALSIFNMASFYRQVKLHTGWMSIERFGPRVQSTLMFNALAAGVPVDPNISFPVTLGAIPVKMHYIRLRNDEHSFMSFMNATDATTLLPANDKFVDHPRRRTIVMKPGRRYFFRFRPEVELPADSFGSVMYRNYSGSSGGPATEQMTFGRIVMTPRSRRVGWLPTRYVFPGTLNAYSNTGLAPVAPAGAGLLSTLNRIVSRKIAFLFEVDTYGLFRTSIGPGATQETFAQRTLLNAVYIRRAEGTKFSFRDLWVPPTNDSANIGQIVRATAWNSNFGVTLGADTATAEKFIPPYLDLKETNQGLWFQGSPQSTAAYFTPPTGGFRLVPFQTETNPVTMATTFNIQQALPS